MLPATLAPALITQANEQAIDQHIPMFKGPAASLQGTAIRLIVHFAWSLHRAQPAQRRWRRKSCLVRHEWGQRLRSSEAPLKSNPFDKTVNLNVLRSVRSYSGEHACAHLGRSNKDEDKALSLILYGQPNHSPCYWTHQRLILRILPLGPDTTSVTCWALYYWDTDHVKSLRPPWDIPSPPDAILHSDQSPLEEWGGLGQSVSILKPALIVLDLVFLGPQYPPTVREEQAEVLYM